MSKYLAQKLVRRQRTRGFTIVELLIATLVFSMVLLLIAEGVLRFNDAYYGGITQSNTQNTARSILENISQAIQFSGEAVTNSSSSVNGESYFCIGNDRYSYLPGWQLVDSSPSGPQHQTLHALVLDTVSNCGGAGAQDFSHPPVTGTGTAEPAYALEQLNCSASGGQH